MRAASAEDMVFLEDGAVAAAGTAADFFDGDGPEAFRRYIGSGPVNTGNHDKLPGSGHNLRPNRGLDCGVLVTIDGGLWLGPAILARHRPCLAANEPKGSRPADRADGQTVDRTVWRDLRLPLAAAWPWLLAGCQMIDIGGEVQRIRLSSRPTIPSPSTMSPRTTSSPSSPRAQHPRILATYGGEYSDPKLERMVAKVVGNLTLVSANPAQTYRITILNSPNVNAFALPGGYLYVTRGLLALANDSAELAAVIAHEMGHVTANHGLQRQQLEAEEGLATKVVSDVLGESARPPRRRSSAASSGLRSSRATRSSRPTRSASSRSASAGYDPFAAGALPAIDVGL